MRRKQTWTLKVSMLLSTPSRRGMAVVSFSLELFPELFRTLIHLSPLCSHCHQSRPAVSLSLRVPTFRPPQTLTFSILSFQIHPSLPRSALGHGQRNAAQVQRLCRGIQEYYHRNEPGRGYEGHVDTATPCQPVPLLLLSQMIHKRSHLVFRWYPRDGAQSGCKWMMRR